MAEYIDREALIAEFDRLGLGEHSLVERVFSDGVRTIVAGIPAADVAPVVHGRWIVKKEWRLGRWVKWLECSNCGEHEDNFDMYEMMPFCEPYDYCPNCGAKMDGGAESG